jgi:DNA-nicking Smr family endonuclease
MVFDFLLRAIRRARPTEEQEEDESLDPMNPFPDPVIIEFRDVIDLHSIPPKQVRAVVEDYLEQARERGVAGVRIIHGKGIGVQREIVRSILARTPYVVNYGDAPLEAGAWGATVVALKVEKQ